MSKPEAQKPYPQSNDWIMFKTEQKLAVPVVWQEGSKSFTEKYYLIDCYWSPNKDFETQRGAQGKVTMWAADIFVENAFEENAKELSFLGVGDMHVTSNKFTKVGTKGHWVKVQLNDAFCYGQDEPQPKTKSRFIVYHPLKRKPRQAHFLQGEYAELAKKVFPSAMNALASKGLKILDPTGLTSAGLKTTGIMQTLMAKPEKYLKAKFGHPLHYFGSEKATLSPEQLEKQNKELEKAIDIAAAQIQNLNNGEITKDESKAVALLMLDTEGELDEVPLER